jgi:hypothetical protein
MATVPEPSDSPAAEAERRLAARLDEVEQAVAQGRLGELAKQVPTVDEQLRLYVNESSAPS